MKAHRFLERALQSQALALERALQRLATATDPEALHQVRVDVRVLRATLRLTRNVEARSADRSKQLHRVIELTGDWRDWDVLLDGALTSCASRTGPLPRLPAAARAQRAACRTRGLAALRSPGFGAVLAELQALALPATSPSTVSGFARQALESQHRRLREDLRDVAALDAHGLHRLRIRAKRLRYTAELFIDVFPRAQVQRYRKALRRLQDELGAVHDAQVGERLAGATALRAADRAAAERLRGWCAAQAQRSIETLPKTVADVRLRRFWGR